MAVSELQNFYKESIAIATGAGAGNIYVTTKPVPTNGFLVISPGSESLREIIRYTGTGTDGNGDYVTVANIADRGLGGTTAQAHEVGEPIRMNYTAEHQKEIDDTIEAIVAGGTPDASTTVKGRSKLSVAPVDAADPIAVGDNDPRLLDADLQAALAGGDDFGTPSTSNKFLTEDITEGIGDVVRKSLLGVVTAGTTTRAANAGAGAVTVAHGLGAAPKYVKLNAVFSRSSALGSTHQLSQSFGFADASNNYCVASRIGSNDYGSTTDFYVETLNNDTYSIYIDTGVAGDNPFSHYQRAIVTFDATNITFTWTNATAEVSTTIKILWEAYLS